MCKCLYIYWYFFTRMLGLEIRISSKKSKCRMVLSTLRPIHPRRSFIFELRVEYFLHTNHDFSKLGLYSPLDTNIISFSVKPYLRDWTSTCLITAQSKTIIGNDSTTVRQIRIDCTIGNDVSTCVYIYI